MNVAYIGLGSNIEPRHTYLNEALKRLETHKAVDIKKTSSIYETEPVDYLDQDRFLNMVVEIETVLSSMELLKLCQQIELELGRDRSEKAIEKGPRTIDLDILLFNDENKNLDELQIPHPRMHERAFVLVPLNEIAPTKAVPHLGQRVNDLLKRLPASELRGVVKWKPKATW